MVAADYDHRVWLGFLEVLADQPHRGNVRIQLRRILARRTVKKLRGVNRAHCCHNFSHVWLPHHCLLERASVVLCSQTLCAERFALARSLSAIVAESS